jgi:general L-amino acid transport system permease protein
MAPAARLRAAGGRAGGQRHAALLEPWLAAAWAAVLGGFFALMKGGVAGLSARETDRWGGLPLTVMLATVEPGDPSRWRWWWRWGGAAQAAGDPHLCVLYVELIRGVPLISVLFMASFMLPLFMPQGMTIDVLLRVLVGITLFSAAYLAEVVRGGLQAIPKGQQEAAEPGPGLLADAAQDRAAAGAARWWCRPS